jgi:hypothetical protein
MRVSTWEGFLPTSEVAGGQRGGGAHSRLLTETADWAMLHNTSRASKQHGTYLALSAHKRESSREPEGWRSLRVSPLLSFNFINDQARSNICSRGRWEGLVFTSTGVEINPAFFSLVPVSGSEVDPHGPG